MRVSRRSFLGSSIASIGLLFGGFGWRAGEEEDWYLERETGLTIEKLLEAKRVLSENGGLPENGKYWFAIHPDRVEEAKRLFGDQIRVMPAGRLPETIGIDREIVEAAFG